MPPGSDTERPSRDIPPTLVRRILSPFLPVAPITRADWWVVFGLWLTGVLMGWSQGQASALLPFSRGDLGLTEGEMSLVLAVARLSSIAAILFGVYADRRGRRRPLLVAMSILLVAGFASAFVESGGGYAIAQSFARIGGVASGTLAAILMAESISPRIRAYGISFLGAAGSLGAGMSVLGLPLVEIVPGGWRTIHALPALGLLLIPVLWRVLPEVPPHRLGHDLAPALVHGEPRRRLILVSVIGIPWAAFTAVALAFTTERLIGDLGFSGGTAALISLSGGTLGGAGFFIGGRLADRWGRRPTTILAFALTIVGGLALFRVATVPLLSLAVFVSALGSFMAVPAAGAHRAELFRGRVRGLANTVTTYVGTVGSAIGLLVGSLVIDEHGLNTTLLVLAVGVVIAMGLTMILPETLGVEMEGEAR